MTWYAYLPHTIQEVLMDETLSTDVFGKKLEAYLDLAAVSKDEEFETDFFPQDDAGRVHTYVAALTWRLK